MAEPFVGEIRIFSFGLAPKNWATCDGQTLMIKQNQALYALLGVRYGGNATTNFILPDLRGRVPLCFGANANRPVQYAIAAKDGKESVTLTAVAPHNHPFMVSNVPATRSGPAERPYAVSQANIYAAAQTPPDTALNAASMDNGGGGGAHPNMQPFLTLNFCIALTGIYPPRN